MAVREASPDPWGVRPLILSSLKVSCVLSSRIGDLSAVEWEIMSVHMFPVVRMQYIHHSNFP